MVCSVGEGPTACQKQTASALLSAPPTLAGARSVHTTQSWAWAARPSGVTAQWVLCPVVASLDLTTMQPLRLYRR